MRIQVDNDYEEITGDFRKTDPNHYCSLTESEGFNPQPELYEAHWHEWLEISRIIDGEMDLECSGKKIHVSAGQVFVVGVQEIHGITGYTGSYHFQCLHINIGFIMQNMNVTRLYHQVFLMKHPEKAERLFSFLIPLITRHDAESQMRLKAGLLLLLAAIADECDGSRQDTGILYSDTFSEIVYYIAKNYNADLSLKVLSEKFGYTPQYLSNLFKKYMQTTYHTYLTKIRLDRARFLLMTSSLTVVDIAYACGFSSENAMNEQFKKQFAKTPLQYRREVKIRNEKTGSQGR